MNMLIASPERIISGAIRSMFEDSPHAVEIVHDLHDFGDVCRRKHYRTIVSLFTEPFVNGDDLARTVRRLSGGKTEIFVLSWAQHPGTVLALYDSGIHQYIALPVDLSRLRKKLRQSLDKKL